MSQLIGRNVHDYDLCVIGGGPGGVRAARLAAAAGSNVVLIEAARLGGTCVNLGCIPKKFLVYAGQYREARADARAYGFEQQTIAFDWARLRTGIEAEIGRLNGVYARLLQESGCEVLSGQARVVGPHSVAVDARTLTAERILVATGGRPLRPAIPGAEHAWVSDDVFSLARLPASLVVVGGGYIAVEMASICNALGVKVRLIHRSERLLQGFDEDLEQALPRELGKRGIEISRRVSVLSLEQANGGLAVQLSTGEVLRADAALFAIGREPNTEGLGLHELGVRLSARGAVEVDADFRSSVPSIHALGDVIDRVALAPVAIAEAERFQRLLQGERVPPLDYHGLPTAVFSSPEVGTVGWTEQAARTEGHAVRIYRTEFRTLRHALSGRPERCLVKLVVDADSDRVLGAHMLGPEAAEVIQGLAVAITAGASKQDFDRTLAIHPSFAEEFVTLHAPVD